MALRNQPYFPLYVQDVLSDEKLVECSAESHGVYFRLLCILHKQDDYGKLYLKAKYKQNESKIKSFAILLSKPLPFTVEVIENSLTELIEEKVLYIDGDFLCQKRMIRDCEISQLRAGAGSKGGKVGRNSGTKRYYNVPGYLYLIYDDNDNEAFKVGISQEPDKRIYGIIRKTQRPNLKFRKRWYVDDMGEAEQIVLDYYDDIRDGEWIYGKYNLIDIEQQILKLIKSKLKANSENANEYENENENSISEGGTGETSFMGYGEIEGELLFADSWLDVTAIQAGSSVPKVKMLLRRFIDREKAANPKGATLNDFRRHFVMWLNKEVSKDKPTAQQPQVKKLTQAEQDAKDKADIEEHSRRMGINTTPPPG